ncbi:LysM peptidoglycan-binding domain-containing protein [Chloroflexi bacterium TSY]|nr:LysM peptidoglycan-binding domain-containing protein [Chloroflexi bacterium TSY]
MNSALCKSIGIILILATLIHPKIELDVHAQTPEEQCLTLRDELRAAITDCDDMNSNWACYGSIEAKVVPVQFRFHALRDRRPLTVLEEVDTNAKGVVFMNLQIEGESNSIKAMLFGNAQLETVDPEQHSFIMQIDDTTELCQLTPPGMILHTETGESGEITLNSVTIAMASTTFITFDSHSLMTIVNLDGEVTVIIDGVAQALPVGQQVQVEFVNGAPVFSGPPIASPFFDSIVFQWLATEGLQQIKNTNQTVDNCNGTIEFGETISTQNVAPGQECLINFCAETGDSIALNMNALDPTLNPSLNLRGPDDLLLSFNNDVAMDNLNSQLCKVSIAETSCDYTIVARSHRNETFGRFNLSLSKQSDCVVPEPRCDVMAHQGIQLHQGPGLQFPDIATLTQGTHLRPIGRSQDGEWISVDILRRGLAGWVQDLPENVECEFTFPPAPTPPPCQPLQPAGWIRYTVVSGDTLSGIAGATGTSVARLREVNCLPDTLIRSGQNLYVPRPVCSGVIIAAFSAIPGTSSTTVSWRATGGCAPLSGTIIAVYSSPNGVSSARYTAAGVGSMNIAFPDNTTCPLMAQYGISMRDRSGQGASFVRSVQLRETCPKLAPFPTP